MKKRDFSPKSNEIHQTSRLGSRPRVTRCLPSEFAIFIERPRLVARNSKRIDVHDCFFIAGLVYGGDPNGDLSGVIDYTYTDLPYPSSLAPWNHSHYGPDYHVFSNVQLSNQAILFYAEATHQAALPEEVVLNTLETEIHLPVTRVSQCSHMPAPASALSTRRQLRIPYWSHRSRAE